MRSVRLAALPLLIALAACAADADPGDAADPHAALLAVSSDKWDWMAERDTARLDALFLPEARFVHMSGTWGKARELEIIDGGDIWYKQADVLDRQAAVIGDTGVVWSRISLNAVVRGEDVTNPFLATETYVRDGTGEWRLAALSFSLVRETHEIE